MEKNDTTFDISMIETDIYSYFEKKCKEMDYFAPKLITRDRMGRQRTLSSELSKNDDCIEIFFQCEGINNVKYPQKLKYKGIRVSMFLFNLLIPMIKQFNSLTAVSLQNCQVTSGDVKKLSELLHENQNIKDLNIDMNPNDKNNHCLLCTIINLQYLSLKLCELGDVGIEKISAELKYNQEKKFSSKLIALNLAHNQITDVGAGFIAEMLHTNRSIRSLDLSGNFINDSGTMLILSQLYMFPLTHEEIVSLRKRKYVQIMEQEQKNLVSESVSQHLQAGEGEDLSSDSKTLLKITDPMDKNSEENLTINLLSVLKLNPHPFDTETYPMRGEVMSRGNLELQHFNLSYNHLTKKTLQKMIKCVYYHNYVMLNDASRGLLYVNLEGNNILKDEAYAQLEQLLYDRQQENGNKNDKKLAPVEGEIYKD